MILVVRKLMKLVLVMFIAALAARHAPSAAAASTIIVGVSPMLSAPDRAAAHAGVQNLLLRGKAGASVQVFDLGSQLRVLSVTLPESPTLRIRQVALKRELAALHAFMKQPPSDPSSANVPAFMTGVVPGLRKDGVPTRVLLFASLFHADQRDSGGVFSPGSYMSDGCVLADSRQHVLGTRDRQGILKETVIDWCFLSENVGTLDRRPVVRLWSVWASELGATLSSCQGTPNIAVESLLSGKKDPVSADSIDRSDVEIAIRRVPGSAPSVQVTADAPAATPEQLRDAAGAIPTPRTGGMTIGIVWTSAGPRTDVDLYCTPKSGAAELSFQTMKTPEGEYLRDIRSPQAPSATEQWRTHCEVIRLERADPAEATCWVNLFDNPNSAPVTGIVRILIEGRTVDVPFRVIGKGDKAAGRNARDRSASWLRIDIAGAMSQK